MSEILHEAGWPIYPVLALGLTALLLALRHAVVPQRNLVTLIVGLGTAAFLMGLLGTVLGVEQSIRHVAELPPEKRWIVLLGLSESLHNAWVALSLLVPTAILAMVGSYRFEQRRILADGQG